MTFGPGRGVDFETFTRLVKRLTLKVITSEELLEVDMPMEFFNVPIFRIQAQAAAPKASPAHTGGAQAQQNATQTQPPRGSAPRPKGGKKRTATQTATARKRGMVK